MLSTAFGDLVALWWVVADSPGAKISWPLEECSPIFLAMQMTGSNQPYSRLNLTSQGVSASGPEIDCV
jgi:hypothetical protein